MPWRANTDSAQNVRFGFKGGLKRSFASSVPNPRPCVASHTSFCSIHNHTFYTCIFHLLRVVRQIFQVCRLLARRLPREHCQQGRQRFGRTVHCELASYLNQPHGCGPI